MDFIRVFEFLIDEFNKNKIRYGLMGGFALYFYDIPRATADLDFLIEKDDLPLLDKIMTKHGYELIYRSENVSQFVNKTTSLGEIDFIHAFRDYAKKMINDASIITKENLEIKVLKPEAVIGLKVQAMVNDETRRNRELADIEAIIGRFSAEINWTILADYFMLFGLNEDFDILKNRYAN